MKDKRLFVQHEIYLVHSTKTSFHKKKLLELRGLDGARFKIHRKWTHPSTLLIIHHTFMQP